jgi:Tol biopolymer transport system component
LPPTPTPTVTPVPPTQISFVDVRAAGSVPSLVEISFSLRDDEGRAVVVQSEALHSGMRSFEDGPGTDGWEEIDLAETSFFVQAAENLDLEIVFILDFTNSMAITTGADGRSGIEVMLAAFEAAVASLPGSHRIGVVEFHDRNFDPTILSEPTIDRGAVLQAVRNFANSGFEPGSSRVWDSIEVASSLFTRRELSPDVVRAVVFISDGRDTSSVNTRSNAREIAERQEVQLYALGVGDVFEPDELEEMAEDTGGKYYSALEIGALQEQLSVIVSDLRGQYKVNYTTLRRQGTYASRIEVDLPTMVGALETPRLNVAEFFGPDNVGRLAYDPPSINTGTGIAQVFIRAVRIPRNIDRFRFKIDTTKPHEASLVARSDGGLISDWEITGPDRLGFFDAKGSQSLGLGASGLLFKLTVSDVVESRIEIPVAFDNTIYRAQKSFIHPSTIFFGQRLPAGGKIAFRTDRTGNEEIFVLGFDGAPQRNLSNSDSDDFLASWSPDGSQLVFDTSRNGSREIYVMNSNGSQQFNLTNSSSTDFFPAWSPDGRKVAFSSTRGNANTDETDRDIYVIDLESTSITKLTENDTDDWWPSWSPDGSKIAFATNRDGEAEIFVMDVDGGSQTNLTNHPSGDFRPMWSPDGQRIVFHTVRDGNREVYVMDADGSNPINVSNHPSDDWYPSWSPNGSHIAFASTGDGNQDIFVMYSDGAIPRNVTNNPANDIAPVWGP